MKKLDKDLRKILEYLSIYKNEEKNIKKFSDYVGCTPERLKYLLQKWSYPKKVGKKSLKEEMEEVYENQVFFYEEYEEENEDGTISIEICGMGELMLKYY